MRRLLFQNKQTMKKLIIKSICILTILYLSSCSYKFNDPENGPIINPADTVKFSTQITPIFSTNNNCTTCHKTGGTSPDLSATNAFAQLTSLGLIDNGNAANSKIYSYVEPNATTHSWKHYTSSEAQIVLLWLTQGAKNN